MLIVDRADPGNGSYARDVVDQFGAHMGRYAERGDKTKNKNIKPTAFHFTAAQQEFLDIVEKVRAAVRLEWVNCSLFEGHASRPGSNLRWDPAAERNWALMANDPTKDGTSIDAPLEWLAFRGLPLFPSFPFRARIITTAVSGRGEEMELTWLCLLN